MKGVSLAIETIIILILAVSVLTVLLFFLRSQVGPAQDTATLLREQTSACSAYVGADPACTDATDATQESRTKLATACKGLYRQGGSYSACSGGSPTPECIKACCRSFCPP